MFNIPNLDVFEPLTECLRGNSESRIALSHLDMDVKEPAAFPLAPLYSGVIPRGLIVIDDYNSVARAVEAVDALVAHT